MRRRVNPRVRRGAALLLVGLVGLVGVGGAASGVDATLDEATRLLERMTTALGTLEYRGTLVYLADNRLETLQLVHHVGRDGIDERLVSLSGPPRSLARAPDRVTCELPDTAPLRVALGGRRQPLAAPAIDPTLLAERYRIEVLGPARVAGRETEVLRLRPRDGLRYGNAFHLDRASGLPLKTDLIDDRGEPLEQILFTAIEFTEAPVVPEAPAGVPAAERAVAVPAPAATPHRTRWRFDGRAPGFELAWFDLSEDGQGRPVEHYLFSDRLSSYSVYIEAGAAAGLDGTTRIGAVHAAGRIVDGHRVTAVGEVPAATVEAAISGLRTDSGAPEAGVRESGAPPGGHNGRLGDRTKPF